MAADTSHHIIGLIPSRWGSSRFPGKPLHPIAGKPLVQHVWERVCRCSRLDAIAIATDDQRIFDAAVSFGARAIMTSPDHPSGSDRLAEAVRSFPAATHIVNIQGDEPLIDPALIDRLAEALVSDEALSMATVACPISRDFLENYVRWAPTPLEQTESLEQLRALENGARIRVILTDHVSVGVDTPEQAEQVEQILLNIH